MSTVVEKRNLVQVQRATVRFAGDSGDGMQLVGTQFADLSSLVGNVICTLPDYPSEIRAPAGSLAGVSGYQLNFGGQEVMTPGDSPFILVAMNPAALKVNLPEVQPGGIIVVNEDEFTPENLAKARYDANPLEDGSLHAFQVIPVAMTRLNDDAVKHTGLSRAQRARCKNFFALGIMLWLYDRPMQPALEWLMNKFGKTRNVMAANGASLRAGYNYANTAELFRVHYQVERANLPKGRYRRVTGNEAIALGLVAGSCQASRPLVYASYPITPASEIFQELSQLKEFDVRTLQAEDEIAACCAAVGASFAGAIGATGTSGPGLALKAETLGLAVMTELPLDVVDVQRSGPSTGMPTKTEQADLLMALYGRHGEAPVVVLALATPADGFHVAFEAVRLATKYMTPVLVMSDSYLANCAEPMLIPDPDSLPGIEVSHQGQASDFRPYLRDPQTLARPWVAPGTPGMEHRIGGLEKEDVSGMVSYDATNHQQMVTLRARKIAGIADDIPEAHVEGDDQGDLLIVGWGSTYGAIAAAVDEMRREGKSVSHLQLRYINPFPRNLGDVLARFRRVLVPENNLGQLSLLLRVKYPVSPEALNKIDGRPFLIREIRAKAEEVLSRD